MTRLLLALVFLGGCSPMTPDTPTTQPTDKDLDQAGGELLRVWRTPTGFWYWHADQWNHAWHDESRRNAMIMVDPNHVQHVWQPPDRSR